jgi:hypothetical protein
MTRLLRRAAFAVPFGCLVAIATHAVRFGDDHAFGGEANPTLVAAAVGGSSAIALAILHAFLTAGTTMSTGTIAAVRARELVPNAGTILALAATVYYGIESLEGHGLEIGLPTLLLAVLAAGLAVGLRTFATRLAGIVADLIRDFAALLARAEHPIRRRSARTQPIHSQVAYASRRFGRAPPLQRRPL